MRSQVARKQLSATEARNLRRLLLLNVFEPEEIGARIQQARERAGLRQEDLAELLGVATRTIQNYEGGATKQYAKLRQIAALIGTTPEWLLHGDAPSTEATPDQMEIVQTQLADLRQDMQRLLALVESQRADPSQDH